MTETMKKFKPPFRFVGSVIYDANDVAVIQAIGGCPTERAEIAEELIKVLKFHYANKRERGERKGEKE